MTNFTKLGEPTSIYADIVYTPTEVSQPESPGAQKEVSGLDWSRDILKNKKVITPEVNDDEDKDEDTKKDENPTTVTYEQWLRANSGEPEITPETKTNDYTAVKGFAEFKRAYQAAGADPKKFNFFAYLAKRESGFNPTIQNKAGAPAYGYFQFMQGTSGNRSWNNVSKFAGVDLDTFRNSPEIQIKAAMKLEQAFLNQFTKEDIKRARELGYSDSALVAGAWLGGVGGVRKFLHQGINIDDKSWSKTGAGVTMKQCMDNGNNYY